MYVCKKYTQPDRREDINIKSPCFMNIDTSRYNVYQTSPGYFYCLDQITLYVYKTNYFTLFERH